MNKHLSSFFRDKKGHVVITQQPNLPLIGFVIFSILGVLINKGSQGYFVKTLAFGSLFTWCWLEIFSGSSPFRRVLGLTVLIGSTVSIVGYLNLIIPK